ncbi:MAG: hypothetical protein PHD76_08165 [Methylacidiphilales bacterium]|nr:hypothetical protein [Candidatus Methylacidiphilales bacterium]
MKHILKWSAALFMAVQICVAGDWKEAWQYGQGISVPKAGIYKFDLSPDVLGKSQADLRDLRFVSPGGEEVGFAIGSGNTETKPVSVESLSTQWLHGETIVQIKTNTPALIREIQLSVGTNDFQRSAKVEAFDGREWVTVLEHDPIYRQRVPFEEKTNFKFSAIKAREFRVAIPDDKGKPIIVNRAYVVEAERNIGAQTISYPIVIRDHVETVGKSYYSIQFPAANLPIYSLAFGIENPVFQRSVKLSIPNIEGGVVTEREIAQGALTRSLDGKSRDGKVIVPFYGVQTDTKECRLYIENGDNPPLKINEIEARVLPLSCVFYALSGGTYQVLTGNKQAEQKHYDVSGLKISNAVQVAATTPLKPYGNYKNNTLILGNEILGGILSPNDWQKNFSIQQQAVGVQELELPPEALACAGENLGDARIIKGNRQIPYWVERLPVDRTTDAEIVADKNNSTSKTGKWEVRLPLANLPVKAITLESPTQLFERTLSVYEEDMGHGKILLGSASWKHVPQKADASCLIQLYRHPQSKTLFIETDNGDNAPIEISKAEYQLPIIRLLYYRSTDEPVRLLAGNPNASTPQYDIASVLDELKTSPRSTAKVGNPGGSQAFFNLNSWVSGESGILYWIILAGVVIGLFFVMTKLLPASNDKS